MSEEVELSGLPISALIEYFGNGGSAGPSEGQRMDGKAIWNWGIASGASKARFSTLPLSSALAAKGTFESKIYRRSLVAETASSDAITLSGDTTGGCVESAAALFTPYRYEILAISSGKTGTAYPQTYVDLSARCAYDVSGCLSDDQSKCWLSMGDSERSANSGKIKKILSWSSSEPAVPGSSYALMGLSAEAKTLLLDSSGSVVGMLCENLPVDLDARDPSTGRMSHGGTEAGSRFEDHAEAARSLMGYSSGDSASDIVALLGDDAAPAGMPISFQRTSNGPTGEFSIVAKRKDSETVSWAASSLSAAASSPSSEIGYIPPAMASSSSALSSSVQYYARNSAQAIAGTSDFRLICRGFSLPSFANMAKSDPASDNAVIYSVPRSEAVRVGELIATDSAPKGWNGYDGKAYRLYGKVTGVTVASLKTGSDSDLYCDVVVSRASVGAAGKNNISPDFEVPADSGASGRIGSAFGTVPTSKIVSYLYDSSKCAERSASLSSFGFASYADANSVSVAYLPLLFPAVSGKDALAGGLDDPRSMFGCQCRAFSTNSIGFRGPALSESAKSAEDASLLYSMISSAIAPKRSGSAMDALEYGVEGALGKMALACEGAIQWCDPDTASDPSALRDQSPLSHAPFKAVLVKTDASASSISCESAESIAASLRESGGYYDPYSPLTAYERLARYKTDPTDDSLRDRAALEAAERSQVSSATSASAYYWSPEKQSDPQLIGKGFVDPKDLIPAVAGAVAAAYASSLKSAPSSEDDPYKRFILPKIPLAESGAGQAFLAEASEDLPEAMASSVSPSTFSDLENKILSGGWVVSSIGREV
jgi:hypothetical protein